VDLADPIAAAEGRPVFELHPIETSTTDPAGRR
jgi:hypothetical protein